VKLHLAVRGACWLIVEGQEPLHLDEGDLAISNGSLPSVMASDPAVTPRDVDKAFTADATAVLQLGGDEVAGVVGHVQLERCCEERILAAIPTVTHLRAGEAAANVLHYLLDGVLREISPPGPGSRLAGEQYAQLILVEVLRVVLDAHGAPQSGWLRLLADMRLRPALALMHERPAYPWRVADLAEAVSMSRSTFIARFRRVSGQPPLNYLHHWRVRLAQVSLRDTDAAISALAADLGYASESSFSQAFARTTGVPPRSYRALHRRSAQTPCDEGVPEVGDYERIG
jgi:AraC-like DNA-binding protein